MAQNRDKRKVMHFSKFLEFGTVKPCLTATSVIQLPRHYGRLSKTTIHFLVKKTPHSYGNPVNMAKRFWPIGDRINSVSL